MILADKMFNIHIQGPCDSGSSFSYDCYNGGNCHEDARQPKGAECLCQDQCPDCYDGEHCEYCK